MKLEAMKRAGKAIRAPPSGDPLRVAHRSENLMRRGIDRLGSGVGTRLDRFHAAALKKVERLGRGARPARRSGGIASLGQSICHSAPAHGIERSGGELGKRLRSDKA
jgi:hypothetical protein